MSNLLSNNTITLTDNQSGDSCELPVISGSVGPDVIDIRKLYSQTAVSYTHLTLPTTCSV